MQLTIGQNLYHQLDPKNLETLTAPQVKDYVNNTFTRELNSASSTDILHKMLYYT